MRGHDGPGSCPTAAASRRGDLATSTGRSPRPAWNHAFAQFMSADARAPWSPEHRRRTAGHNNRRYGALAVDDRDGRSRSADGEVVIPVIWIMLLCWLLLAPFLGVVVGKAIAFRPETSGEHVVLEALSSDTEERAANGGRADRRTRAPALTRGRAPRRPAPAEVVVRP